MEDLFLKTRLNSIGLPFPLISTQVGDKVFEDLKSLLPYISFRGSDPKNGEFGNLDREIGLYDPLNELQRCQKDHNFSHLLSFIQKMEPLLKKVNFSPLKEKLLEYKKIHDRYLLALAETGFNFENKIKFIEKDIEENYSVKDLLSMNWDASIEGAENALKQVQDTSIHSKLSSTIIIMKKAKEYSKDFKKNYPAYSKFEDIAKQFEADEKLLPKAVDQVSEEAIKLYDSLYKYYSSQDKSYNACKNIKL